MFVVVKTHSFDPENEASTFESYEIASAYLRRMWKSYLDEELRQGSELQEDKCCLTSDYGLITWSDGCFTVFILTELTEPHSEFLETNIVPASFTSVWDGGEFGVTTACKVDLISKETLDIEASEDTADLVNVLEEEYVTIFGKSYPALNLERDEITAEGFWYV